MAICRTCKGSGEYKSGCHLIACPENCDCGEVDGPACYTCGFALIPGQIFEYPKFTDANITLYFCSQKCVDNYEENGYMEAEEDYYCGEREVDSDPYD